MNKAAKQTLALASIFQTTALVHQLASTGQCDNHSNKASLNSIVSQSDDVDEIFSSPEDLRVGFESLKTLLEKKPISMQNIMLYSTALINLEKKLMKKPQLLTQISAEIDHIKKQDFFEFITVTQLPDLLNSIKIPWAASTQQLWFEVNKSI